jgi:hypothetical protein
MALFFVDFQPEHLLSLPVQPAQVHAEAMLHTPEWATVIKELGPAWTAFTDDGIPVACAGVFQESLCVWAVLAPYAGRHMLPLFRRFRADVERLRECGEVWMFVQNDFPAGVRMARMLGMKMRSETGEYTRFSVAKVRYG